VKISIGKNLFICTLLIATMAPLSVKADDVDTKISEQTEKISTLKEQRVTTEAQIASLEKEIATIYSTGVKLQNEQLSLEKDTAKLTKEISDLNGRIAKRTETMKNQARDIQVNGQDTSFVDAVLNADSVSDAVSRIQAVNTFVKANNDLIQAQKADKLAVEQKKAENEHKANRLREAKAELDTQRKDLVLKQADLTVQKLSLAADQATAESTRTSLLAQKAQAEAEQARVAKAQAEEAKKSKSVVPVQVVETAQTANKNSNTSTSTDTNKNTETTNSSSTETTNQSSNTTTNSSTENSDSSNDNTSHSTNQSNQNNESTPIVSGDATLNALNALRASHGLKPVSWDAGLAATATSRASLINGNGGAIPNDHWSRGNEVIAILFSSGVDVINAWYNETNMTTATGSGHRDWEINPSITRVGFGYSGSVIVGHSA
jgi:peptidoglycan hydrolase CwlO-like protein